MSFRLSTAWFLLAVLPVAAFDPARDIAAQEIPGRTIAIAGHGAKPDTAEPMTEAIQRTLDTAIEAGGGRVVVPAGRFLCGPLRLGSGVDFHLEAGAVLVMSDAVKDFPAEGGYRPPFLSAKKAHDVRLSGRGTIEGQGKRWWEAFLRVKGTPAQDKAPRRPQLISFEDCERVEVSGITTTDPPNTHYSFKRCSDFVIRGIRATAPDESPNTDALNLSCVRNVLVEGCFISTGDDNIVLLCGDAGKDGRPGVENVVIRDCEFGYGHGLSIGSYTSGGVRNVRVENVGFDQTTSGIRLKAGCDRGGVVEKLVYRDVRMRNVRYPVFITSYYPGLPNHPSEDVEHRGEMRRPVWRDILIEDLDVTDCRNSIIFWGLPDEPVSDVTIRRARVSAEAGAHMFHARGITLEDFYIQPESGPKLRVFDAEVGGLDGEPADEPRVRFR